MSTRNRLGRGLTVWIAAGSLIPTLAAAGVGSPAYRTGPSSAPARQIALDYLQADAARLGVTPADLAEVAVTDEVRTAHNGVTHVYVRQRVHEVEVDGTEMGVHVDALGRVFHVTGRPIAQLAERATASPRFPLLTADEAVAAAARALGIAHSVGLDLVEPGAGADQRTVFSGGTVSEESPNSACTRPRNATRGWATVRRSGWRGICRSR